MAQRSDVYSLGAVLYEFLTKEVVFNGNSIVDIFEKITSIPPTPPRYINPKISVSFEKICLRCLEKEPRLRYQNLDEVAFDLEKARDGKMIFESTFVYFLLHAKSIFFRVGILSCAICFCFLIWSRWYGASSRNTRSAHDYVRQQ